jgi:hypothetical protein
MSASALSAGCELTSASDNIDIGNTGVARDSGGIRIGTQGTQQATYVAGISGVTVAGGVGVGQGCGLRNFGSARLMVSFAASTNRRRTSTRSLISAVADSGVVRRSLRCLCRPDHKSVNPLKRILQVNSVTGPSRQLKAPAAICRMLTPCLAGEVLKMKLIVMLLFDKTTLSAGVPFTVKSLASRVAASTGSVTSTLKTTGGTKTTKVLPQPGLVTEQGVAVSEAMPSRNVTMAIINIVARVIKTFHYQFVVAV